MKLPLLKSDTVAMILTLFYWFIPIDAGTIFKFPRSLSTSFTAVVSPLYVNRAPGEASAKCSDDEVVTLPQLLFVIPQQKGNRSARGVAVTLNVHHHLVFRYAHPACRGIDNPFVGLVRDQPGNGIGGKIISFRHLGSDIRHISHRKFVDCRTFLVHIVQSLVHGFVRSRHAASACLHI